MWHKFWISILANVTEEALAGVKVKIDGGWYRPVLTPNGVWYEGAANPTGCTLIQPHRDGVGPITEIKMPVNEKLSIGGSSGCGH